MAFNRLRGDREEKTVILDSNAILMLFEFSIDLENELTRLLGKYKIVIPQSILEELRFLSTSGAGKKKVNAKASLKLIEKYDVVDADGKNADDSVLSLAQQTNGIVVTNDRELRNRLKQSSITVIFLRAKKKLSIE